MAAMAGHWTLRGYGFWALESKATGEFVGWAGLFNPEGWPEPEIGWTLLPGARGQGFATEAVLRSRAYAYETLGWKTAISLIRLPNEASIAVAERVGAHLERATIFREAEIGIYRHPNNVGDPTLKPQLH
jgi:RimJ/RimL family protein N-acetyltransferase